MTKRFVKFSSLFVAVAMLLGLMVTACTDKDRDIITPPEEDGAVLYTTVGFNGGETNGFDCPTDTKYIRVVVNTKDGVQVAAQDFAATAEDGVTAWTDNNNGTVTMAMELNDEQVGMDPSVVAVGCADANSNVLGGYVAHGIEFTEQVVSVDFSSDEYQFINPKDFDYDFIVEGYSQGENLQVYLNKETPVTVLMKITYKDVDVSVDVSDIVELDNATCKDCVEVVEGADVATLKGKKVSVDNTVKVKLNDKVVTEFKVDVTENVEGALLFTKVAKESVANGSECPADTAYIRVIAAKADGTEVAAQIFGAEPIAGLVKAWSDNGDGILTMDMELSKAELEKEPVTVFAGCVDDSMRILGGYFQSDVKFEDTKLVKVDFSKSEFSEIGSIKGTLEVVGYDDTHNWKVAKDEKKPVQVLLVLQKGDVVIKVDVSYNIELDVTKASGNVEKVTIDGLPGLKGVNVCPSCDVTAYLKVSSGEINKPFLVEVTAE